MDLQRLDLVDISLIVSYLSMSSGLVSLTHMYPRLTIVIANNVHSTLKLVVHIMVERTCRCHRLSIAPIDAKVS